MTAERIHADRRRHPHSPTHRAAIRRGMAWGEWRRANKGPALPGERVGCVHHRALADHDHDSSPGSAREDRCRCADCGMALPFALLHGTEGIR